jgi:type IV pilus assembly protein PilM
VAPVTCGLYVGGETLSLLALTPNKKSWTVQGGAAEFHALGENDDLSPALKALVKPLKLASPEAIAILPKQQAILRNVLLPSTDREELIQMVRFEAERHIPFHAERHSTGFHVMRSMGVEGSEVLLGAVDGPIVQRLLDGVLHTGMTPKGATLSSVCLMNTLHHHRAEWAKGKTVAILSLGLDSLDLVLVSDGRVIFARSVSLDLRGVLEAWAGYAGPESGQGRPTMARLATAARMIDCTDLDGNYGTGGAPSHEVAEQVRGWIDRVMQELRRTYDFARREMKCPPIEALALTGEGALMRNLAQYLFVNLNVEVQTINPLEGLARKGAQKFPFDGFEFAIAFGGAIAAQTEGAYRIDLTPQEHYRALARKRLTRQLTQSGVLLAITLGLCVASYMKFDRLRAEEMEAYTRMGEKMAPQVSLLSERKTKLEIIKKFLNDPNAALRVLNSIAGAQSIPARVTMTSILYTKGDRVEIEGDAKQIPDINTFTQDMRGSNCFENVEPAQDPQPGAVNNQPMYSFKLDCPLVGSDKSAENR